MKTVCIVGAGPAGLVSAKTLLQHGQFDVTVYEKSGRLGGIWALDKESTDGFLDPNTPTNLSRFTVAFSDLDWNDVDLAEAASGVAPKQALPMFPKAWMANRYLEAYRRKYIPDGTVLYNRTVTRAKRDNEQDQWKIITCDTQAKEETRSFDYLIMASGFFAQPRPVFQDVPRVRGETPNVSVVHSSSFRTLDALLPHGVSVEGKKILMVGGGNSSGETAAAVAMQLSDAQWSPNASLRDRYAGCRIVHVTPRPLYPLPPFNECEEGSCSYMPLDLKLYDISRRPRGQGSYAGLQTMEVRNIVHGMMEAMVGGNQADISGALVSCPGPQRSSAYVALTETYSEFARADLIDVVAGRVTGLESGREHCASAIINQERKELRIDDIAAVIVSTGYTPCPALDLLDEQTKAAIQYDPTSMRLPMILEQWQTMARDAPNVSFVGWYEGPYWGMMEMQARLTAHRWLTGELAPQKEYERPDQLLKLRQAFKDRTPGAPQFWYGDYSGYLRDIAEYLGLTEIQNGFRPNEGVVSPARWLCEGLGVDEAAAVMRDLHSIWSACRDEGLFVARAAFRALQGHWNISRKIESVNVAFPSGTLEGTASFHPRLPIDDNSGKAFDLEYLYVEHGTFTSQGGLVMTASRRYVYRYSEADDRLSVWFVKPENDAEVDYHFHDLHFVKPVKAREKGALVATASHLCVADMYETEYMLPMRGVSLHDFTVKHTVSGPAKGYVSTTSYSRPRR